MSWERILSIAIPIVLVMLSASIHEFGHAITAYRLGDDTAKRQGRLTLNPTAHLDPFGSVLLPLLMGFMGGPIFAFAKPVPYNPNRLRNPRRDEVLVALAGPATNLLQACIGGLVYRLSWSYLFESVLSGGVGYWICFVASSYAYVNCVLMFFNLIPLPPLDGSSIISPLLKGSARRTYYMVQHYSLPILMALLYLVPRLIGIDVVGIYLDATAGHLFDLLLG